MSQRVEPERADPLTVRTYSELKRREILDGSDGVRVIDFVKFRKRKTFPRCPNNMDLCERLDDVDFSSSFVIFISHCWLRGHSGREGWDGTPHPDNAKHEKFRLVVEAIDKIWGTFAPDMDKCYVWLDFGCINQDGDPCGELKHLDLIIQSSDLILTAIVDDGWASWDSDISVDGALSDYKAKAWQEGYLQRAWCRVEMLYSAYVPLRSYSGSVRNTKFRAALRSSLDAGRRAHMLYGTRESKTMHW